MNPKKLAARSDIRPLEFTLAVVGGGVGSAMLSAYQPNPWVSVGFALTVMGGVSFLRWRIASKTHDFQSLEAFSEDVYLLGYLLTLAALLGLAPRLMTEETNLFHIAGVKLFTTMAGLAVMMVFRQMARGWAAASENGAVQNFVSQEELFGAAVARLNRSAEDLTAKMEEVAQRFDPDLLGPVAEWSNRAANALSGATRALEIIPDAMAPGTQSLQEFSSGLQRVKSSMTDLSATLTGQLAAASQELACNLGQASGAARNLGTTVTALQPASEAGRVGLENLGSQALQEVSRLGEVNQALGRIAIELTKVDQSLRQLDGNTALDLTAPLNRLVQALAAAADNVENSSDRLGQLRGDIQGFTIASDELVSRLSNEVAKPLATHEIALVRVQDQLADAARQIERVAQLMGKPSSEKARVDDRLVTELGELRVSMAETNVQLQLLIGRIDGNATTEPRTGIWNKLFGGNTGIGKT